jgi:hypothetical protein
VYSQINCPVLLLTVDGDDSHPVSTTEGYLLIYSIESNSFFTICFTFLILFAELVRLLPNCVSNVVASVDLALDLWPALISSFLDKFK